MKKEIRLGDFELFWMNGGKFELDGGAMFGVVPKALWSKKSPSTEDNTIPMVAWPLLVRTPDTLVLIETGLGNKLTEKLPQGVPDRLQIKAAEGGRPSRSAGLFPRQEGHPDGAEDAVVGRDDDARPQNAGKRRRDGIVVRRPALEIDRPPDASATDHAMEVVEGDGVREARNQILPRGAALLPDVNILLHEDRQRSPRRTGARD